MLEQMKSLEDEVFFDKIKEFIRELIPITTADFFETHKPEEIWNWYKICAIELCHRLVDYGICDFIQSDFDAYVIPLLNNWRKWMEEVKVGKVTMENWAGYCTGGATRLIDAAARVQQNQAGHPVIGFKPSQKLTKGREALDIYHKDHVKRHTDLVRDPTDNTKALEKLESVMIEIGYESLTQFLRINAYVEVPEAEKVQGVSLNDC